MILLGAAFVLTVRRARFASSPPSLARAFARRAEGRAHSFPRVYDDLLRARRGDVDRVLVVGVGSGASAEAWAASFPGAVVVGADASLEPVRYGKTEPRIRFVRLDGTTNQVAELGGPRGFDVVVDGEAGRGEEDRERTLAALAPLLKPTGIYFVECGSPDGRAFEWLGRAAQNVGLSYNKAYDLRAKKKGARDDVLFAFSAAPM